MTGLEAAHRPNRHALGMNKDTVAKAIKDTVAKAINDLIESGHMRRIEKRAESGRFAGWDYEVLSGYFPVSEEFGSGDLAGSGKPVSGKPVSVNSGRIRRLYS